MPGKLPLALLRSRIGGAQPEWGASYIEEVMTTLVARSEAVGAVAQVRPVVNGVDIRSARSAAVQ